MKRLAVAFAALAVAVPSIAVAADPVAPIVDAATFDWQGVYVGVGLMGSTLSNGGPQVLTGYVNLTLGANAVLGQAVVGIEGSVGGYASTAAERGFYGSVEARAGVLVDPAVLLYGTIGAVLYDAGARYGTIGFGTEFAVSDKLSIDFDYQFWGLSNNGFRGHSIGVSANWQL
jgi:opacity protein-like surface antigen